MPFVNGYLVKMSKDPVLKHTQNGKMLCTFGAANTEGWGENKKTLFMNCVAFEKTANTINTHFKKGDSLIVEGSWQNNPYRKDEKGYDIQNFQFIVSKIHFLPKNAVREDEDCPFVNDYQQTGQSNNSIDISEDSFDLSDTTEDLPWE